MPLPRDTKIQLAYHLLHREYAKSEPLLANFKAVMDVSKRFGIPFLQTQQIVKTKK